MKNLLMLSLVLVAGLILIAGCSSTTKGPETPITKGLKSAPEVNSPGGVKVLEQQPNTRPDWVDSVIEWRKKNPDVLYFVGISLPNEYEAKATESARDNASAEIAGYLFNCVDIKKYFSEKERNSEGFVPVQAIARDSVVKHIVASVVQNQYGISRFTQYCVKNEYGASINFYQVYVLFEYPKTDAQTSIAKAREEIQQKVQEERDEAKRKLLEQSDKMLQDMEKEITKPVEKKQGK